VAGIVTLSSQPLMEEGMEELRKVACHAHDTPPSVALQYPSTHYTKTLAGLLQKFLGDGQIDQSGIDIFVA
jgi:hypothetical protein